MKAAIAELERQLVEHDAKRDRIVTALNALRELADEGTGRKAAVAGRTKAPKGARARRAGAPPARQGKATPTRGTGKTTKARRGPGGSVSRKSPADWERARAIAEREGAKAAGRAIGVSPERVRQVAKQQGWKILKKKGGRQPTTSATTI